MNSVARGYCARLSRVRATKQRRVARYEELIRWMTRRLMALTLTTVHEQSVSSDCSCPLFQIAERVSCWLL